MSLPKPFAKYVIGFRNLTIDQFLFAWLICFICCHLKELLGQCCHRDTKNRNTPNLKNKLGTTNAVTHIALQ